MRLKVNSEELQRFLSQSTFQIDGDCYEQEFGKWVIPLFPNCEEFWRVFVIPMTSRIEIPDGEPKNKIRFRDDLDSRLVKIASMHYSMFMHLGYAYWHHLNHVPPRLENIYAHLGSTCELAESTIESLYLLLLTCQGKKSRIVDELSREEVMAQAGIWYENNYANTYNNYFSKGHEIPLYLFHGEKQANLLHEYFGKDRALKNYLGFTGKLRHFRNVVVHDVKVGEIYDEKKDIRYIPKLNKIDGYRTWKPVFDAKNNQEIIDRDFMEIGLHAQESIQKLEICLDTLWTILINDFKSEFYSIERNALRDLYQIEFSKAPTIVFTDLSNDNSSQKYPSPPPSGTFSTTYDERYISSNTSGSASAIINNKNPK
jgi:hypothetical protein